MSKVPLYYPVTDSPASVEYRRQLDILRAAREQTQDQGSQITPADQGARSRNPLRPARLAEVIGQAQARELIAAALRRSRRGREPFPHMLLVGPAGTGKTTLAQVVATELGVHVYQLAAPVSHQTLLELREVMHDGDVLFVDEIHGQAIQERRGKEVATSPETFFSIMEDRVIATANGVLPFPQITLIGGTTDEGMLPDAFVSRFPLKPRMVEYTPADLGEIAHHNAKTLGATLSDQAAAIFAIAARGTPREINNLVRNAVIFAHKINAYVAREVLRVNGVEEKDGLTADQAALLKFVLLSGRRVMGDGTVRYQCSVTTIATGIGKSRDTKSVTLRIEPWLIRLGYLSITHGGRMLTERGVARANELLTPGATPYGVHSTQTPADRALERLGA